MEITTSSNDVTIKGNIKTISDFQQIKQLLDNMVASHKHKTVILNITDSLSMTSSVIGYFNKLVLKDKINIQMRIGNQQLLELLTDLNLASTFNTKKA